MHTETMTTAQADAYNSDRRAAMFYAWGYHDAAPGDTTDAQAFALHYAELAHDHRIGRTSYMPSVQDAYRAHRAGPQSIYFDADEVAWFVADADGIGLRFDTVHAATDYCRRHGYRYTVTNRVEA